MQTIKRILQAGETQNLVGDAKKIKIRSTDFELSVRTSYGAEFPCKTGDLVSWGRVSNGLTIKNLGGDVCQVELILMDDDGATYESSAGAVEVTNFPAPVDVQKVDVQGAVDGYEVYREEVLTVPHASLLSAVGNSATYHDADLVQIIFDKPVMFSPGEIGSQVYARIYQDGILNWYRSGADKTRYWRMCGVDGVQNTFVLRCYKKVVSA